jgi:hypothetical protein
MIEMKKAISFLLLLVIFFLLPGCQKPVRDAEHSWQYSYTEEFLNYKVQDDWLIERVSLLQFKEQIRSNSADEQEEAHLEWFEEKYQKGDKIWRFMNPPEMWENLQGVSGYVLYRGGRQIATFITNTSNIEMFLIDY